jgi:hypothetical protein
MGPTAVIATALGSAVDQAVKFGIPGGFAQAQAIAVNVGMSSISPSAPIISNLTTVGSPVQYGIMEIQFDLTPGTGQAAFSSTGVGNDRYSQTSVEVWAIFESPTAVQKKRDCYWHVGYNTGAVTSGWEHYSTSGTDKWRSRWIALETGTWTVTVYARDNRAPLGGLTISSPVTIAVLSGSNLGYLRRDTRDGTFLQYAGGTPFYPRGLNIAHEQDGHPSDGITEWTTYLNDLQTYKGNIVRRWMDAASGDIAEWLASSALYRGRTNYYGGLGVYNQVAFHRMEGLASAAASRNIAVIMAFMDYRTGLGGTSSATTKYWDQSPYSSANGGPVPAANSEQFWTNTTAQTYFKRMMRYWEARLGAYWNIIKQPGNELTSWGTGATSFGSSTVKNNLIAWNAVMSAWAKAGDGTTFTGNPYQLWFSGANEWEPNSKLVFDVGNLDNQYADTNTDAADIHRYIDWERALIHQVPSAASPALVDMGWGIQRRLSRGRFFTIVAEGGLRAPFPEKGLNYGALLDGQGVAITANVANQARDATDWRNKSGALAMRGQGYLPWWWYSAHTVNGTARPAGSATQGWPDVRLVYPHLDAFMTGEDIAGWDPLWEDAPVTTSDSTITAVAMSTDDRCLIFVRDLLDQYDSGSGPAVRVGRSLTGKTIYVAAGLKEGTYTAQFWNTGAGSAAGMSTTSTITVKGGIAEVALGTMIGGWYIKLIQLVLTPTKTTVWRDGFDRNTAAGSAGTGPLGTTYSVNSATLISCEERAGPPATTLSLEHRHSGASETLVTFASSPTTRDVDAQVEIAPSALHTSSLTTNLSSYLALRATGTATSLTCYYYILIIRETGQVDVAIHRVAAGVALNVTNTNGIGTFTGGSKWNLRAYASGTGTTTVRLKAWQVGTAEPASWTLDTTDALGPQVTGGYALRSFLGSNALTFPTVRFDNLWGFSL